MNLSFAVSQISEAEAALVGPVRAARVVGAAETVDVSPPTRDQWPNYDTLSACYSTQVRCNSMSDSTCRCTEACNNCSNMLKDTSNIRLRASHDHYDSSHDRRDSSCGHLDVRMLEFHVLLQRRSR